VLLVSVITFAAMMVYLLDEVAPSFVQGLAFSPDDSRLVSVGPDRSLQL